MCFRKFVVSGIAVSMLLFLWMGNAMAAKPVPGLLRIFVNTEVKDANKKLDDALKRYGKEIEVINQSAPDSPYPFRDIRVKKVALTGAIVHELKKLKAVKKVKGIKKASAR
ncbi:MAG: hypothetical protein GY862_24110 [Gammaproteobacteria bacterium]|nr:hypothetical protein [Gammaproteobacteria bacterium]